jgi:hypothetical protein
MGLMDLKLEPGESDKLVFYVHDIIEGSQEAEGLKLFCKDLETDERISISLEIRSKESGFQSTEGTSEDNYTREEELEGEVYTILNYPKNPKTPGEVVATALFISDAVLGGTVSWDKYLELFPKSAREEFEKEIRDLSDLPEPYGWIEVRILKVEVFGDGTRATVTFSAKRNKGEGLSNEEAHCIKENGAWKLEATS